MYGVRFSDHAVQRWTERIQPVFSAFHAVAMVRESRLATKAERRRCARECKSFARKSTKAERNGCRVNDQHGIMFFLANEVTAHGVPVLVVKTVLKVETT